MWVATPTDVIVPLLTAATTTAGYFWLYLAEREKRKPLPSRRKSKKPPRTKLDTGSAK